MIVYKLADFAKNPNLSPRMRKAVDFLLKPETASLPDGTYPVDGRKVYAQIQTYMTAEPKKILFEAHKKYLDIQYVVEGQEIINCVNLEDLDIVRPYEEKFDICFGLASPSASIPLRLLPGDMTVFFPEHAHAPKLPLGGPRKVKKIVVKVSVA
ncbi:MAG: YhcH/YjgK/YiaL family protein [Elusimicrobiales bacterium]|jgi:YhcH/YjgK/YiaL family protein|nr:YhcH/YjgK/YiaL family protein [Elusimicrobiales bacterium]